MITRISEGTLGILVKMVEIREVSDEDAGSPDGVHRRNVTSDGNEVTAEGESNPAPEVIINFESFDVKGVNVT